MSNAHTESGTFTFVINFASLHKLLNDVECTLHPFLAWSGLDFLIKAHRDAAPSKGRLARRADKVLATHFALVSMELSSSNQSAIEMRLDKNSAVGFHGSSKSVRYAFVAYALVSLHGLKPRDPPTNLGK